MFNFKALALAATLAIGGVVGGIAPANAGTCWFDNGRGKLAPTYCQTNRRINNNGHVVYDVVDHKNNKMVLVIWDNYTAEMIMNGQVVNARSKF